MGKRSANRYKSHPKNGQKKAHVEWSSSSIPEDNQLFRQYYRLQLNLPEQEFKIFWSTMKQKLPVVFRVNPTYPNHKSFCNKLNDQNFMKSIVKFDELKKMQEQKQKDNSTANHQPKEMPKIELLNWYPGKIVYTISTNKQQFKKSQILSELHKYLQKSFDSGLISRQQLVSMLPPLYLDIQQDDMVLDMCAAPGSKTSQMLEMIYKNSKKIGKGCVIANDADYSRAQMLIHQINRAGTAGTAVINHSGQFLPELYYDKINHIKNKFQFDKILCDVPCSGDGATRKIPIKWAKWHTSDGVVLHPLQLSILMKSINLLKRGGLIVYSTCSLNPMENEAVLNALFQKVNKGLQIVDIHQMYEIKGRRGLLYWQVCGITHKEEKDEKGQTKKELRIFKDYEEAKINPKIKPSLFPPSTLEQARQIGLQNSMRVLPHDQNSGGFFVALIKKHYDFEWKYCVKDRKDEQAVDFEERFVSENLPDVDRNIFLDNQDPKQQKIEQQENQQDSDQEQDQEQKQLNLKSGKKTIQKHENNKNIEKKNKKSSKYQIFSNIDEEQFEMLKNFYGLNDNLKRLFYVREIGNNRKVMLVSEGVRSFLQADTQNKIKLVNMGCKVFEKGKQSFAGHQCLYRLCQQGIDYMLPLLEKRKVKVPLEFFRKVLSVHSLTHEQIQNIEVRQKIRTLTQGSFVIYIDEQINGQQVIDAIVGQNFKNSLHLMISKDDVSSLNIRYL